MQVYPFDFAGDDQPEEQFGFQLGRLSRRWRTQLDDRLRPLGLTQARWIVLVHLSRGGDSMLQKDLAEYVGIEGPSLVRILDALEAQKLVERRPAPNDRRGKTVHLTDKGRQTNRQIHDVAVEIREKLLQDVPRELLVGCLGVFRRIQQNADRVAASNRKGDIRPAVPGDGDDT